MWHKAYHSCDAPRSTDVRRDTFQGHDRARAGLFGYTGLLGVPDVHDEPTLRAHEHHEGQ